MASLALVSLGAAPAAAADTTGTLAIVNGVPGQKIDICIGDKEQSSGLYYGGIYEKDVIGTGARLLRFYKKNAAKTCGGTKIAQKTLNVTRAWTSPSGLAFSVDGALRLTQQAAWLTVLALSP